MWEFEHTIQTQADPDAIWSRWVDVASWPEWNAGVRHASLDGAFAPGARIRMELPEGDVIPLRIAEVESGQRFVDEMDGGDFLVRTSHEVASSPAGSARVTYRTTITGPAAETIGPELGPQITGDFPEVMAALATAAS